MSDKEWCELTVKKCFKHIIQTTTDNKVIFGINCYPDKSISCFVIDPKFFQLRSKIRSKLVRQLKIAVDEYATELVARAMEDGEVSVKVDDMSVNWEDNV